MGVWEDCDGLLGLDNFGAGKRNQYVITLCYVRVIREGFALSLMGALDTCNTLNRYDERGFDWLLVRTAYHP